MEESTYLELASKVFRTVDSALGDADPSQIEVDSASDVMSIQFTNHTKCILNTQRPTRQMWLAAKASAWHFSYDEASKTWLDDKGRGELFAILSEIVRENSGLAIKF
jgi:CyaY protein